MAARIAFVRLDDVWTRRAAGFAASVGDLRAADGRVRYGSRAPRARAVEFESLASVGRRSRARMRAF